MLRYLTVQFDKGSRLVRELTGLELSHVGDICNGTALHRTIASSVRGSNESISRAP